MGVTMVTLVIGTVGSLVARSQRGAAAPAENVPTPDPTRDRAMPLVAPGPTFPSAGQFSYSPAVSHAPGNPIRTGPAGPLYPEIPSDPPQDNQHGEAGLVQTSPTR